MSELYEFFVLFPAEAVVQCGRGSIVLWQCCDTLCTSGFVDDVIWSRRPDGLWRGVSSIYVGAVCCRK